MTMSVVTLVSTIVALTVLVASVVLLTVRGRSRSAEPLPPSPRVTSEPELIGESLPAVELPMVDDASSQQVDSDARRWSRLASRLSASSTALARGLTTLLRDGALSEATWEEFVDLLVMADVGVELSQEIVDAMRQRARQEGVTQAEDLRPVLRRCLVEALEPHMDRSLADDRIDDQPSVILMVGVNGTGKTTTTGKLARLLVARDRDVLLGAADTFRAAATEQLQVWGDRSGVPVIHGAQGADPASVAFEAVKAGVEHEVDVIVIDTAGRLHNRSALMDELAKVRRVIERSAPVREVLLVIDATTGQNGLEQARVFAEAVAVTGVVLTKLDGSAKGGIVLAVQRQLGVPVKLVGLGEGPDDLAVFDAEGFADALTGDA